MSTVMDEANWVEVRGRGGGRRRGDELAMYDTFSNGLGAYYKLPKIRTGVRTGKLVSPETILFVL